MKQMSLPGDAGVHLRTFGGCSTASGFITNTSFSVQITAMWGEHNKHSASLNEKL